MAGALGAWVTTVVGPDVLRWVLGASFIAMAVWMLIPDKMDEDDTPAKPRFGVFGTTVVAFFLAEMGDKTQVATVMLAAQYQAYYAVIAGTTLGMMLANAPVVWLGERMTRLLPLRVNMRIELSRLHKELRTTMIYVTHDQVEAMTMGDRIAVFNKGHVEQLGVPMELYNRPANEFVATFIGAPRINLVDQTAAGHPEYPVRIIINVVIIVRFGIVHIADAVVNPLAKND